MEIDIENDQARPIFANSIVTYLIDAAILTTSDSTSDENFNKMKRFSVSWFQISPW